MNKNKCRTSVILALCIFLFPGFSAVVNAQSGYDRVFIFGDSLSDSGNIYALTGETSKAPYLLIPSAPYAIGGHHFSNGKTWSEKLAQALNDNEGGKPARNKPGKNGNYAHGGARARTIAGGLVPSSSAQVGMFLRDFGVAPSDALYVIQFGGNDLRDILTGGDPGLIMNAAIGELVASIQTLHFAGARKFLVANAPNIEHAPAVQMAGGSAVAGFLAGLYNGNLEGALQIVEDGIPDIEINRLNMAGFVNDVVAQPGDFGLANVTAPCLNFLSETGAKCDNPEDHFFWDGLHPTKAGHKALAGRAMEALGQE